VTVFETPTPVDPGDFVSTVGFWKVNPLNSAVYINDQSNILYDHLLHITTAWHLACIDSISPFRKSSWLHPMKPLQPRRVL
jgi:hypothetical protein